MFKNKGQKKGTGQEAKGKIGSNKGKEVNKEKLAKVSPVEAKLKKISKALFAHKKATNNDALMRAQLNG